MLYLFVLIPPIVSAQIFSLTEYQKVDSLLEQKQFNASLSILEHILTCPVTDSIKAELFFRKGYILFSINNVDSADYYFKTALTIFKLSPNLNKASEVDRYIGRLYLSKRNYGEALYYDSVALSSSQLAIDSLSDYLEMCNVYGEKNDWKRVHDIIVNNIYLFKNDIRKDQTYLISSYLGAYYKYVKNYDSSLFSFKKALLLAKYDEHITVAYENIADAYKELKNYKIALLYQDSAFQISGRSGTQQELLDIYDGYKEIYSAMGNTKNAFRYSELARKLSDNIYEVEQAKALQDGEVKYQTKQIEGANKLQAKDIILKNRNLTFSFIGLALVALLAAITYRSYKQKQKANKILTTQKEQVQQLANELETANQTKARLFSTISHDLRSPISSLYAMLKMQQIKGGTIDAVSMSNQTIHLLDTLEDLLVWSKTQMDRFVPMPVLVDIGEMYDGLIVFFAGAAAAKNIRLVSKTHAGTVWRCDENILRTILRNAIGNGINHTKTDENVVLETEKQADGKLVCSIKNQCEQIDFERFKKAFENTSVQSGSRGFGLVLIKEFAQKINASINIVYLESCVAMRITIP